MIHASAGNREVGLLVLPDQLRFFQAPQRELEVLSREAGLIFQIQNRQASRLGVRAAPVEEYTENSHTAVALAIETGCKFFQLEYSSTVEDSRFGGSPRNTVCRSSLGHRKLA